MRWDSGRRPQITTGTGEEVRTEDAAKVVAARKSHEKRGNMSYERLTIVVEGAGGRREAFKEVTIGTALPTVQVNAEASVLSHAGATVIVVGRDVFDA